MSSRIPRTIQSFNDFINYTTDYLLATEPGAATANWERLTLTTSEKNQWVAFRSTHNDLYGLYVNKNETRTKSITDQLQINTTNFKEFAQPLLNRIAYAAEVTIMDLETFNIKAGPLRDNTPTPKPAITTQPYPEMQPMGGGMVKITVREQSDASRASMHPDADSIEMAYHIGTSPPANPTSGTKLTVYKGAIHTFEAGAENTTKRLYAYFRWNNTSDSSKSGPWSNLVQVVIA